MGLVRLTLDRGVKTTVIGTNNGSSPSKRARAAVVLGKAITSRSDGAPASSIAMRSKPSAKPPCGGAP